MSTATTLSPSTQELEARHVLQVYRRTPVVFDRGEGVHLITTEGTRYLDFISGVGVASLGHAHPGLAAALADQSRTLLHTSNLFFHPLQAEVATRLSGLTGLDRAFFCNSGTEAVETCLKFARRYSHTKGATARTKYVAFSHSFHGRTMGSLSVTWDDHYRAPFAPLIPNVVFVDNNDPAALSAAVDADTAAIIVEPIQGEGGVRPVSKEMAAAIEAACARTGALLIADEVQSGLGRTGAFLYSQTLGLTPDLVALGKALGAGVPVGVAMFSNEVASAASPGDHGSTYGGNLLACRAALVFLDALATPALKASMANAAARLGKGLCEMMSRVKTIRDVRGTGLMVGIDLTFDATPVVAAAFERGLLINRTSATVVRLLPPYIVTDADVEAALPLLEDAIVGGGEGREVTDLVVRAATMADAEAIHELVQSHLDEGHLLPRQLSELRAHAERFVVCDVAGQITACAELAPLSQTVAEVRSLVVSRDFRRVGLAQRMVNELRTRAKALGFDTLTAFTHDARFFVRQGFSIVPHVWVPEKIMTDCVGCPLFRHCEQYAVVLPLTARQTYRSATARTVSAPAGISAA